MRNHWISNPTYPSPNKKIKTTGGYHNLWESSPNKTWDYVFGLFKEKLNFEDVVAIQLFICDLILDKGLYYSFNENQMSIDDLINLIQNISISPQTITRIDKMNLGSSNFMKIVRVLFEENTAFFGNLDQNCAEKLLKESQQDLFLLLNNTSENFIELRWRKGDENYNHPSSWNFILPTPIRISLDNLTFSEVKAKLKNENILPFPGGLVEIYKILISNDGMKRTTGKYFESRA